MTVGSSQFRMGGCMVPLTTRNAVNAEIQAPTMRPMCKVIGGAPTGMVPVFFELKNYALNFNFRSMA
jgi:hypothetical protein